MPITTYLKSLMPDGRSLGLFRILLGISFLHSLVFVKWTSIPAFWGSHPIVPPEVMGNLSHGYSGISVFSFIHSDGFAYLFFSLAILSALSLTIGYYSTLSAWLCLFFHWNIVQAYAAYSFGFDLFLFQILLWSCFLPLDSELAIRRVKKPILWGWFALVLIVQITWIYFNTGLAKYGESWMGGYAVRNMLMDYWGTTDFGKSLSGNKLFYVSTNYLSLFVERLFPLLVFLKPSYRWPRFILVLFLFLFHLSILLSYHVGNFSLTGIAVAAFFIPAEWWDKLKIGPKNQMEISMDWPFDGWKKKAIKFFVILATFIICQKNIFFILKHSSLKTNSKFQAKVQGLLKLDIPSPLHVSFFWQYWKMFAPNPSAKCGWIALEELRNDEHIVEFFSKNTVVEKPAMLWKPTGLEFYLLMYARTFDLNDPKEIKFKIFLKYWIKSKLGHLPEKELRNLFLTNYLFIIANQKNVEKIPIQRQIISVETFLKLEDPKKN
jgi:hypothetical protein